MDPESLHTLARRRLAAVADPDRVAPVQRYLKTDMPLFGVAKPLLRPILRELTSSVVDDAATWEAVVRSLWRGPERELKYLAIGYVRARPSRRFLTPDALPLLEQLVREGAWWDLVDEIAVHGVGPVVAHHREEVRPVLEAWIGDPDVWVRRTALLCQLQHKEATDFGQLTDFVRRQAADESFWIRKAIGWALRQHSRTDPDAVRAFLASEDGQALAPLSRREAAKHLGSTAR